MRRSTGSTCGWWSSRCCTCSARRNQRMLDLWETGTRSPTRVARDQGAGVVVVLEPGPDEVEVCAEGVVAVVVDEESGDVVVFDGGEPPDGEALAGACPCAGADELGWSGAV